LSYERASSPQVDSAKRSGSGSRPGRGNERGNDYDQGPVVGGTRQWVTGATEQEEKTVSPLLLVDQAQNRVVVSPRGELDIAACRALAGVMKDACRFGVAVVVDLAHITFVDCSGLSLLLSVRKELAANGCIFTIINASARVARVFAITHLDHLLDPYRA